MDYNKNSLEEIHENLVQLLDFYDEICKKNKLTYFLAGGTALGAKRHKGFIPWDDDIDVVMPREDYEKFIAIASQEKTFFVLKNHHIEKNYFLPFSKIAKKDSYSANNDNCVFIDIFPIDTFNTKSLFFKIDSLKIKLITHALSFRNCKKVYKRKLTRTMYFFHTLLALPYSFFSNYNLLCKVHKIMTKRNHENPRYVASFAGLYGLKKEIMDYDVYFPPRIVEFEGKYYPTFSNLEAYLQKMYGDYMKIPPINERKNHSDS